MSSQHWWTRTKQSLRETARFMADYGPQLGLATMGTMATAAVTAAVMATNSSHPMVVQELNSMAAGLGLSGVLCGGYTMVAGVMCQRLSDKLDFRDRINEQKLQQMAERMTGRTAEDPAEAIANILRDPRKAEQMRDIVAGTKLEHSFNELAEASGIGAESHGTSQSAVESETDNARMALI